MVIHEPDLTARMKAAVAALADRPRLLARGDAESARESLTRAAELRRDENAWHAVDLGSTNGVKVNGRRIEQVALRDGDRITIDTLSGGVHFAADAAHGVELGGPGLVLEQELLRVGAS